MKKTPVLIAAFAAFAAFAAEPPPAPTREEWGFMKDLARRDPYVSHWTRAAKNGELDLSRGVRVIDEYGAAGDLETATGDLAAFLGDVRLAGGSTPVRLVRRDCGAKEAYALEVSQEGVALVAADDAGMRRAIYFFEDRLLGAEAPALAFGRTSRKPWVRNRITRCFFGPIKRPPFNRDELMDDIDYYPDAYLDRLAHEGVNGLWLTIEFRDIAKTSFYTPSPDADKRLAKLRRTVEKCRRYGIGTWIFCIEPRRLEDLPELRKNHPEMVGGSLHGSYTVTCTATESAQRYLTEATESIFREVPGLAGLINISHGERPTTCLSRLSATGLDANNAPSGLKTGCPRCDSLEPWQVHLNTMTSMLKGMRRVNPAAEIVSWFYQPHVLPERAAWVYEAARHVPEGITFQYNFESGAIKNQCGRMRTGGDYWLSFTGPSMSFERVAEAAAQAGSSLGAKIQVGCSHEVATVPFVPVPGLLYRKYKAMKAAGVSTVMQCWYFGNYPGVMNKAAGELSFCDFDEAEDAFLEKLARPEWGEDAQKVARLWRNLSDAYANYPLSNDMQYYGPFHAGVAWPLYADVRMLPLGRTWKPEDAPSGDTIGESLENHTLDEVIALADRMAAGSRATTDDGKDAYGQLAAKYAKNRPRRLDAGVMNALALQFESGRDIFRFYRARSEALDLSRNHGDHEGARACVAEMKALVGREIEITREMHGLAKADSRLGFHSEAESHQYHPAKLVWRIGELETTLSDLDRIDAALARGEAYPESGFEKNSPSCTIGGEWVEAKGFKFRVDETPTGDMAITVRSAMKTSVSAYTFDMAGVLWQRGVSLTPDGKVTTPLAWNVVTPGHAATGTVRRDGKDYIYTITLGASGWDGVTRLRPAWLQLRLGNGAAWPALPRVDHRLNLGNVQGNRCGRLIRPGCSVCLGGKVGTAVVDLLGGRISSWKTPAGEELLFMPRQRTTPGGDWSHGGIGICWPWFGKKGAAPSSIHGFARNRMFTVRRRGNSGDGETIVLGLSTKEGEDPAFPYAADLELEVSVADSLKLSMRTTNRGTKTFELSNGFQPYFAVGRYDAVTLTGVKDAPFAAVDGMDAAFPRIGEAFSLKDAALGRTIACIAGGNTGVVVWSPGNVEPHNRNLAAGDTERFIGLGPCNRVKEGPVTLAPGATHELAFALSIGR